MRKLEPYFSLVEKGFSTRKVVFVQISYGIPQAEGIDESYGCPCKV
jgi:hypothetical protein